MVTPIKLDRKQAAALLRILGSGAKSESFLRFIEEFRVALGDEPQKFAVMPTARTGATGRQELASVVRCVDAIEELDGLLTSELLSLLAMRPLVVVGPGGQQTSAQVQRRIKSDFETLSKVRQAILELQEPLAETRKMASQALLLLRPKTGRPAGITVEKLVAGACVRWLEKTNLDESGEPVPMSSLDALLDLSFELLKLRQVTASDFNPFKQQAKAASKRLAALKPAGKG